MKLWPSPRRPSPGVAHARRAASGDEDASAAPARLLRDSPVLLVAGTQPPAAVERLLREWNPRSVLPEIADGVSWAGPFRLDELCRTEARLPADGPWNTAYAARATRSRRRVPDGLDAHLLRLRYPHGVPAGDEAVAWALIMGLARRLDGAVRLPVPARGPRGASAAVVAQRPLAQENSYRVYGTEALPWPALRSLLDLSLPGLDHDGTHAGDGYCLRRPGSLEVRVLPLRRGDFVPYALRPYAGDDWPRTTYLFRCVPQRTELDARRIDRVLRAAACQLTDMVGGLLLDGDGFPLAAAGSVSVTRR